MPFLHIKKLTDQDTQTLQGLKKAIRLCKNVKSDAIEEGRDIQLSSFDIASALFYADEAALRVNAFYELGVLAEAQRHLDYLYANKTYARSLVVPDGTRKIFDTDAKISALLTLSLELDDLTKEVAKEQRALVADGELSLHNSRDILRESYIPILN